MSDDASAVVPAAELAERQIASKADRQSVRPVSGARVRLRLVRDTQEDLAAALSLARKMHAQTIFRDSPCSDAKAQALVRRAIERPDRSGLILAEAPRPGVSWLEGGAGEPEPPEGGALAGLAYVQAGEYFLSDGDLVATVLTINITPEIVRTPLGGRVALRLVRAVRRWSDARGCRRLLVHATSGENPARTDRFFRRC
ncbi:hypothetical protein [Stappia indica]|uniref:hypothetical protein n=1 Tax=Stappia indica TaxID=538381 RepID=UPI001CD712E5|nr:hypothetical protein [Stappia indica]MCA1298111.1 hypothetical protein [Stappia indica]